MNPFDKHLKNENQLQYECAKWLDKFYGNNPLIKFHHSPNEQNKNTPFLRYMSARTGVSKGFPDFIIFQTFKHQSNLLITMAIELKHKNNVPTKEQEDWLKFIHNGYNAFSYVVWSFPAFVEIMKTANANTNVITDEKGEVSYLVSKSDILPNKIRKRISHD